MSSRDETGRERRVGEIPAQMIERIWTTVEESMDRSLGGLIVIPVDAAGKPGFFGVWNRQGEAISMAEAEIREVLRQIVEPTGT